MSNHNITDFLDQLGISYRWVDHPAVFTVEESKQHVKDKVPIKNLLLQEKGNGRKYLVIMQGDTRLDMKELTARLGTKKLQFASADTLQATLGVTPGAVSVFGLLHDGSKDVEVIIDESLPQQTELGFHPNVNTATIFMPGSALLEIIKSTDHKYSSMAF